MSGFIKQTFLMLMLCFSGSLSTKSVPLNNKPCTNRPMVIDVNPGKLHYYIFMVNLDRYIEVVILLKVHLLEYLLQIK